MDSLKQFYTIMLLFIVIALFIVYATNTININNKLQYVYIITFVILFIVIIVSSIKFHKLYHANRYFVYGAISFITILFIVLVSINSYMEEFIGIMIDGRGKSILKDTDINKSTFKPHAEVLYDAEISDNQLFDNSVKITDINNVCVTDDTNHFGIYNSNLRCVNPYDEEQRIKKETQDRERLEKEQKQEQEEKEKRDRERQEKMCTSKYIPKSYSPNQYCLDKHNGNNRYGVQSARDITECPGYQEVKCERGYFNQKKYNNKGMSSITQCYPNNSDFNNICRSKMRLRRNKHDNSNKYGYVKILKGNDGNCKDEFHSAVKCSSDFYNGVKKTPLYTQCMKNSENINEMCSGVVNTTDPAINIINTDGCNPGYKRYCCNRKKCMEQIEGHIIN